MTNCDDLQWNLGADQLNREPVRTVSGQELAFNDLFRFIPVAPLAD